MSADDGRKPLPPPFPRTLEGPPSPANGAPLEGAEPAPPGAEAPPVSAPEPMGTTAPGPFTEDPWPLTTRQPAWLRSRRVRIALGVTGVIFLIGIIAAFATDDVAPQSIVAIVGAERVDGGPGVDPGPPPDDPDAMPSELAPDAGEPDAETEDEPAAPVKKPGPRKPAPKRTTSKPAPAAKKSSSGRQVRLSVKSDPGGASIKVDGAALSGGSVMVKSGSTVKVTATKRGYKRVTRSVKVGKGTSIVIKLQKM